MQILPSELVDVIIDNLVSDTPALAKCGLVHSQWLPRSRFHLFSTIPLCGKRAKPFFNITRSNRCTFNKYIKRVEFDDSHSQCPAHLKATGAQYSFLQMMSSTEFPSEMQIEAIQIRNVDWTALSLAEQQRLRVSLARFKKLRTLEFLGVTFHDLREFTRVVASFPLLQHLSLRVDFSKYLDLIIASVPDFDLPVGITSVELGSADCDAVFLHLLLGHTGLRRLTLKNVHLNDVPLVREVLAIHARDLDHLDIDCSSKNMPMEELEGWYGLAGFTFPR